MEFRPCIDIHNGKVKQIVGSSLRDEETEERLSKGTGAPMIKEGCTTETMVNFVSKRDAGFYAQLYKDMNLTGGHIILLNPVGSEFYDKTKKEALAALKTFPGGLQVGGGITPENAENFLGAGASHVIITSYVFQGGNIHYDRLSRMADTVGKERLVLDLSCRKVDGEYRIATDRWQKISNEVVTEKLLVSLAKYCSEFLVHAVDVEGKAEGIEQELVRKLGKWDVLPITYAGGICNFQDLRLLRELGNNRLNVTIGSALDLFGGDMSLKDVIAFMNEKRL